MKTFRTLSVLLLVGISFLGCDGLGDPKLDVQTFNLENRSGHEAADLIYPYVFADRQEAPGTMSATMDAITVRETKDNLEKIGRVLEEFDKAIPSVRLYFQLIEADSFQEEDPAMADVVDELRSFFRFQGYRLLGEAMVPVAGGNTGTQQFSQQFLGVDNPITVEAAAHVDGHRHGQVEPRPAARFVGRAHVRGGKHHTWPNDRNRGNPGQDGARQRQPCRKVDPDSHRPGGARITRESPFSD